MVRATFAIIGMVAYESRLHVGHQATGWAVAGLVLVDDEHLAPRLATSIEELAEHCE